MPATEASEPVSASTTATKDGVTTIRLQIPTDAPMVEVLGPRDRLLRQVEEAFACVIVARGNELTITGPEDDVQHVRRLVNELVAMVRKGQRVDQASAKQAIRMVRDDDPTPPSEVFGETLLSHRGRSIRPKTIGQKHYLDAIRKNTVTFGIGPAGTGKTYLAMAMAVTALKAKQVNRLILTRPAVEAGERLGFLPGTLSEKIDPYLRPLWDALRDMMDVEDLVRHVDAGTIEVAPLAYMRGRAQPVDTPVLTPGGFRPIGELAVGDHVIGRDGRPTQVLGVFPQGMKDVYRVTTQDGASTRACGEHLWTVQTRSDRRRGVAGRVLQTDEMIGRLRSSHYRQFELPMVDPVQHPHRDVPMDPYALGLLLGDGCITGSTTPSFSTTDPELAEALEAAIDGINLVRKNDIDYVLHRTGGSRGGVIVENPASGLLRELELWGANSSTKFVPEAYLHNSVEVRLAVLQGLLDTDGGPVVQKGRTCRIQFTTISDQLRDDVVALVQSLGGVAYQRTRAAAGRKPGRARGRDVPYRHDAHVLDIRLPANLRPFRLARKADLYERDGGGRPMRFIDSIVPDGRAETVCIRVAAEDSLYVTEDHLVTHNTLNDAFIVVDEAQNTTAEQMKMLLTRIGFGSKAVVTGDVSQVDLPSGSRSGLRIIQGILDGIEGVAFCHLKPEDVVRHHIVQRIVEAYAVWDERVASQES